MKLNRFSTYIRGERITFSGDKKCSTNTKHIYMLIASAVAKALKMNKNEKNTGNNSELENGSEQFDFKKLEVGEDSNS